MPFCPTCTSEYRPGIETCGACNVALVAALETDAADKGDQLRKAVAEKTGDAAVISRASYTDACQMVELLHQGGVDAMVHGDQASCDKAGTCSHFFVMVLKEDGERALAVLKQEWKALLEDGVAVQDGPVDLDAEGAHACPACGESFEGAPEECPSCGLFLGATE